MCFVSGRSAQRPRSRGYTQATAGGTEGQGDSSRDRVLGSAVILRRMKLDKKIRGFGSFSASEKAEAIELRKMSYQRKSATITFLRECFYGRKATTGRVQRIFEVSTVNSASKVSGKYSSEKKLKPD